MKIIHYGFLIFVGISLLIMPIAVPIIKTSAEYSIFNTEWSGCSDFASIIIHSGGKIVPILYPYNTIGLSKLKGTLIIIGPNIAFSKSEGNCVKKFIENGGTVFIADDFGTSNTLLSELNVPLRISKQHLKDIFYSKNINFPIVAKIYNSTISTNMSYIVLNAPSTILISKSSSNIKIIAISSKASILEKSEIVNNMKSYPVMVEVKYGKGRLILLSDPSILCNDMYKVNKQFMLNLVRYFNSKVYYIDEAHHSDVNPYSIATVYIHQNLNKNKAFLVFVVVAAIAIFIEGGIAQSLVNHLNKIIKKINIFRKYDFISFDELPEWIDKNILKQMLEEMKIGSKLGENYGWKGIHRKFEERIKQSDSGK